MLTDKQLLRYSRQIMLPQIDIAGQEKLQNAHVLIIGVGGLGSPVALYLAAAGVGKLTLVDDDQVDLSNLQRQIIHQQSSQGMDKVESAKQRLNAINSDCMVEIINQRLTQDSLTQTLQTVSAVADCSDNFNTRWLVNQACWQQQKPLVSGAAIRWEGQLTTFLMTQNSACYACLYDLESEVDQSCSENGVLGPVVGIIGSMQALEVIKVICNAGRVLQDTLVLFDGMDMSCNRINYKKKQHCAVCSK